VAQPRLPVPAARSKSGDAEGRHDALEEDALQEPARAYVRFVQQHTLYITHPNDFVGQMDVCFIGYVRDGRISRAYEYFDTGQIDRFLGPARGAA
jgi:hypothetical protein